MSEQSGDITTPSEMTKVRVVFTVEYEVAEGRLSPPDDEDEALFFVQALLDAAPDRSVDVGWDDDDERIARLEPVGWGVQTDYWGDLWTGIEPPLSGSPEVQP